MTGPFAPICARPDPIFLAPMEGVVDWSMRDALTRLGGIDVCVTEFIRVTDRALQDREFFKYSPELRVGSRTRAGVPVLIQLLGGQPEPMAENAARAAALGAPGIDLNFGCPAKTVNRHDGGAALLKNPDRVRDVVGAVRKAVPDALPVSAKVRLGFSDKSRFLEIALAAQEGGAQWLAVHARTRDEGYKPPAHWEYIARIREALSIPVVANGDIWNLDDWRKCRETTGCAATMLGRGLIARPDLALAARAAASSNAEGSAERSAEQSNIVYLGWPRALDTLIDFVALSEAERAREGKQAGFAVGRGKQWLRQLARTYAEGAALFERVKTAESLAQLDGMLAEARAAANALPERRPAELTA